MRSSCDNIGPMSAIRLVLGVFLVALMLGPARAGDAGIGVKLLRPKDGASFGYRGAPPRIELRWTGSGPVKHYVLQIADESGPKKEVATYEIRNKTAFTFRPKECGTFRWWVAGVGPDGRTTQPGEMRTFVVILGAPEPIEPPEGKVFPRDREKPMVRLSWSKLPVSKYRIELAEDPGFEKKILDRTETEAATSARIESPGTVYWRVRGANPVTKWSKTRSFRFALPVPEPVLPPNGVTTKFSGQTASVELSWRPVAQADSYFLHVRREGAREKRPAYQTRETAIVVKDLPAGRYIWKVRAVFETGLESEPSRGRTFELIPERPLAPEPPGPPKHPARPKLLAPEDEARIVTPKPQPVLLFWQLVDGASTYEVELARSGEFSKVDERRKVEGPMVSIPDLPPGTWFWRVRAVDADGDPSNWTDPWMFSHRVRRHWGDW